MLCLALSVGESAHLNHPGGYDSIPPFIPGQPDQGLNWLPNLLKSLMPPGHSQLFLVCRLLHDTDDNAEGASKIRMALLTGFFRLCRIASCGVDCLLASTATLQSNSDLPEWVAGGPVAIAPAADNPLAAVASTPAAWFVYCWSTARVAGAKAVGDRLVTSLVTSSTSLPRAFSALVGSAVAPDSGGQPPRPTGLLLLAA